MARPREHRPGGGDAGYRALLLPEITGRDALVTLGALAGDTRDLFLGTGVLSMRSRTPMLTAMGTATVDERSGGRLIRTIRSLFAGETIERRGRPVGLSLLRLPRSPSGSRRWARKAMRLAGAIADGALLNWCSPERAAFAKARIAEDVQAAGRDPAAISLAVYVCSWVGQDAEAAMTVLRSTTEPPRASRSSGRPAPTWSSCTRYPSASRSPIDRSDPARPG
ncbi:MAG: LLM class flavin-dependent oxidoreductase, partial [Actinomycetota bacterium]